MIKSIFGNEYIIEDNKPQRLVSLGFHKCRTEEDNEYRYNFTVLIHDNLVSLRGVITAFINTKEIKIDVFDNNGYPYAPFYYIKYGNYDAIMKTINKSILAEFNKLGIKKKRKKGE